MAKRTYSKWGIAAIIAGVVLTAIEVVGAVSYLLQQELAELPGRWRGGRHDRRRYAGPPG
jgi:hypothetical protein